MVAKLTNRTTYTMLFIIILVLVLALAGAYTASPGGVPNPGHRLSEIQGYFQGDANLQASLGKLCQSDGTNCGSIEGLVVGGYWLEANVCRDPWGDAVCNGNGGCNRGGAVLTGRDTYDIEGQPFADEWYLCVT